MHAEPENQQPTPQFDPFVQPFYDKILIADREPGMFIEELLRFREAKLEGKLEDDDGSHLAFLEAKEEAAKRQEELLAMLGKLEAELNNLLLPALEFCNEHALQFSAGCCFGGEYNREWRSGLYEKYVGFCF